MKDLLSIFDERRVLVQEESFYELVWVGRSDEEEEMRCEDDIEAG